MVGLLVLLLVLAAGGITVWLWRSTPQLDGTITVAGPSQRIEILRDPYGIPHIYAATADDAYFGLGFVHAQDRLFQMEIERRLAAGRLSELFGPSTVKWDRFMRLLDLHRRAAASFAALDPDAQAALKAYAAGVNAYMASHKGALSPELALLLADHPEPWTPADSLAWLKVMALRLSGNWREEALRARMAAKLGPQMAASFFPPYPADGPVILEHSDKPPPGRWSRLLLDLLPERGNGSNGWVVDGRHTKSRLPMLANDPHLGLSIPSVWYLAHLHAPGLNVAGATLPGMPIVISGTNGKVAWGVTNTGPDTQDLFVETIDPSDPGRYLTPHGSEPFTTRTETIHVRFGSDVKETVRATRHGPVISDLSDEAAPLAGKDKVVALAWTMLFDDDRTMEAGLRLQTAANWKEVLAAGRDYAGPEQNIVYADRRGNIGLLAPGLVPIRKSGDGSVPTSGATGAGDWIGMIPYKDLPHALNPPSGIIVAANNRLVGSDYPYFISARWEPGYRARRIHTLLAARDDHDVASFRAIQTDTLSGFAQEFLPYALAASPTTQAGRSLKARLAGWDGSMAADLVAPTVFEAWYRELTRAIYADQLGDLFKQAWWYRPVFVKNVLDGKTKGWCDDIRTPAVETCKDLTGVAFDKAAAFLDRRFGSDPANWRWGKVHAIHLRNRVFSMIPGLGALTGVDLEAGGGAFTVDVGSYVFNDDKTVFRDVHGPALRTIIDMGHPETPHFIILPGESGNPFSPHYRDMVARWQTNDPIPVPLERDRIKVADRLVLQPASRP